MNFLSKLFQKGSHSASANGSSSGSVEEYGAKRRAVYKVTRVLGTGSFGVVKEALSRETGHRVAIKSLVKRDLSLFQPHHRHHPVKAGEDVCKLAAMEMTVLNGLSHNNIIRMLEHFETTDKFYMVFEL